MSTYNLNVCDNQLIENTGQREEREWEYDNHVVEINDGGRKRQ